MTDLSSDIAEEFAAYQPASCWDVLAARAFDAEGRADRHRWSRLRRSLEGRCCECRRELPGVAQGRLPHMTPPTRTGRRCPACERLNRERVAKAAARERANGTSKAQMRLGFAQGAFLG